MTDAAERWLRECLRGRSLSTSETREQPCVYVVQIENRGPFKIGRSSVKRLTSRLSSLQTGCPWRIGLCSLWRGDASLENEIHQCLAGFRMEGEWFEPHPSFELTLGIAGDASLYRPPSVEVLVLEGMDNRVLRRTVEPAWHMPQPCWVGEASENHGSYDAVRELSSLRGRHFNDDRHAEDWT